MSLDDDTLREVRANREAIAARFNYDPDAIFEYIKQVERASGRTYVSFPPRPARPVPPTRRRSAPAAAPHGN